IENLRIDQRDFGAALEGRSDLFDLNLPDVLLGEGLRIEVDAVTLLPAGGDGYDLKMVRERRSRALQSVAGPANILAGLVAVRDHHRALKVLLRHPARFVADDRALDPPALRELERHLERLRQVAVAPM